MTADDHQDDDGCEFCAGRAAAARGEPVTANPYPAGPNFGDDGEPSPHYLWDTGWHMPSDR